LKKQREVARIKLFLSDNYCFFFSVPFIHVINGLYSSVKMNKTNEKGEEKEEHDARAYEILAEFYMKSSEYPKAMDNFDKAIAIYKQMGLEHKAEINLLDRMGLCNQKLDRNEIALTQFRHSLKIKRQLLNIKFNKRDISHCLFNIAECYNGLGQYLEALVYYQKCLEVQKQYGEDVKEICIVLKHEAECHEKLTEFEKSIEIYTRIIDMYKSSGGNTGLLKTGFLDSIASCYIHLGEFKKALKFYQKAYEKRKKYVLITSIS
jgi:tetratricopeptide (TPR) repeat protein